MKKITDLLNAFRDFFTSPSRHRTLVIIGILIVAAIMPVTVIVLQQQTNTQQHAYQQCDPITTTQCGGSSPVSCSTKYSSDQLVTATQNAGQRCGNTVCSSQGRVPGRCGVPAACRAVGQQCGVNSDCCGGYSGGTTYCSRKGTCTKYCTTTLGHDCVNDYYCSAYFNYHGECGATSTFDCKHVSGQCGYTSLDSTTQQCIANNMCSGVTTAASIWNGLFEMETSILYSACKNIYGGIPPLADFLCNKGANLRNALAIHVASGVITTCKTEVTGATTVLDLTNRADNACINSCSSILSVNTSVFPGSIAFMLGSVNDVMKASAVPVCKAICPHFVSLAAQKAISICKAPGSVPTKGIDTNGAQEEAKNAVVKETAAHTCFVKYNGTCRPTCKSGETNITDAAAVKDCSINSSGNPLCCAPPKTPSPSGGGTCTGSNCNGGGGSCTNGKTTIFAVEMKLPGIGTGKFENKSLKHATRQTTVTVKDSNGNTIWTQGKFATKLSFTSAMKLRVGQIKLTAGLSCGKTYYVYIKVPGYLTIKKQVVYGTTQTIQIAESDIIPGDIVSAGTDNFLTADGTLGGDDKVTIADYNLLRSCHNVDPNTTQSFKSGSATIKVKCGDAINLFDYKDGGTKGDEWAFNYNLWLRGFLRANGL